MPTALGKTLRVGTDASGQACSVWDLSLHPSACNKAMASAQHKVGAAAAWASLHPSNSLDFLFHAGVCSTQLASASFTRKRHGCVCPHAPSMIGEIHDSLRTSFCAARSPPYLPHTPESAPSTGGPADLRHHRGQRALVDIALERVERERGAPLQRPAALPLMRFKATPGMAQPAVLDMGPGPARQRGAAGSTASNGSPGWLPSVMHTAVFVSALLPSCPASSNKAAMALSPYEP